MIELSPTTALMLYLAVTLFVLFSFWVIQGYKSSHRKISPPEKELIVCPFCHFAFLDESQKKIHRCPQCHLLV